MNEKPEVGSIGWFDLTVDNADEVRDFYAKVVGWSVEPLSMGDYSDYVMKTADTETPVSGVCHRKGVNQDVPKGWMLYVAIADMENSIQQVRNLGGQVLTGPKKMGSHGTFAAIADPSGAVLALFEPA